MDEIDKLINDLEEKSKTSFEEIDLLLDSVDNLIQNTNKELSSENNNDDSKTREILSKKETELRKLKLIPKMNRICNSYYHKYKKVYENIKRLSPQLNEFFQKNILDIFRDYFCVDKTINPFVYFKDIKIKFSSKTKTFYDFLEFKDNVNMKNEIIKVVNESYKCSL